ncbi:MAG TPA: hypothetical protein VG099_03790 [Gemmataceae bacterium]|jgi:VIT1/CCC1 family predicted Fe2+/Mn2+ transporter|nr:hypothetical protein [Gemmataceae bacterium]
MAATLDATTQAAIQQAINDQAAAAAADAADVTATQAVQSAQSAEAGTKTTSITAHKTALASATTAIQGLANALGYTLPVAVVAPPPTPAAAAKIATTAKRP